MNTMLPPKSYHERRIWLKMMLEMKKSSYAAIARELGVTRMAVRKAVYARSPRMEKAIADKIGYVPALIWPERYQTC